MKITEHLSYEKLQRSDATLHIIKLQQNSPHTLLLSKISEAVQPNTKGNHIGAGATMDEFLLQQKGVRLIINGGFNHYRKNFYSWAHQNFNVGDPVGVVKIRHHYFEDYHNLDHYGFFSQKDNLWTISSEIDVDSKYILGCTPLLILEGAARELPAMEVVAGINPPSILGHGMQSHPRTAVGIKDNLIYFLVAEHPGLTIPQLQQIGLELKLDSLLNLDGGGSSQFRLLHEGKYLQPDVIEAQRVLGHAIVLFDQSLDIVRGL